MRQKIAAGNWKMNLSFDEGLQLTRAIMNTHQGEGVTVILGAPYVYLKSLSDMTFPVPNIQIAAQNCHHKLNGAFTGEISIPMLQSININYVIVGHSERREYNHESDELIGEKVKVLLDNGITPIFCCGEPLSERKQNKQNDFVKNQLEKGLFGLSEDEIKKLIIAYEPIWAIGTGETASSDQAQDMHAFIRQCISEVYNGATSSVIPILYGGSVKPANAGELFAMEDVDGGLVGGASLKADSFRAIINSFH